MKDLKDRAQNIFQLAEAMKNLVRNDHRHGDLIEVNKRCPSCDELYIYWDREDCDGENEQGLHYTCKAPLSDGNYCGSTLVYRTTTKAQLRATLESKKALRDAKNEIKQEQI